MYKPKPFLQYTIYSLFILLLFPCSIAADSIQVRNYSTDTLILKSIYPENSKNKGDFYNKLWGTHYRRLYAIPISVPRADLNTFLGGVSIIRQEEDLHALYLVDSQKRLYMLKPLGGSTSFIESDFFRTMYNKRDFRDTYLEKFIRDGYTIINPYTYIASNSMAQTVGLSSNKSRIYYIPANSVPDTIADGSRIQDKLVTIIDVPDINTRDHILTTQEMIDTLQYDKSIHINQTLYIRERVFDLLTGDWNKIPENWNWIAKEKKDSIELSPVVIDRNQGFTKVDGFMYKQLLNVLTLGFIYNYEPDIKHVKKFNKLGYTLDNVLAAESSEEEWTQQARYLQSVLTDDVIENAFRQLPSEIQGEETNHIQEILKARRDRLPELTAKYYWTLQENPVLSGTNSDDHILVESDQGDSVRIRMFTTSQSVPSFDKSYHSSKTGEIWIYGLDGNDTYEVKRGKGKEIPVYLISGKGDNTYQIHSGKNTRIYGYKDEKDKLSDVKGVKKILSDNEEIHTYNYDKVKYHQTSFTPWGFYDSDLGINLGAFYTYTQYGFKRFPFTYQHRIGFSYLKGFMYRGIFPTYDPRKVWHVDATFAFPMGRYNFFGFGNDTDGYKDEKRKYNRVNVRNLTITPSYHVNITDHQKFIFQTSFELYKVLNPDDRFINTVYSDNDAIFDFTPYIQPGIGYEFNKDLTHLFRNFDVSLFTGWSFNLKNGGKNFPFTRGSASIDIQFSELFTWALLVEGTAIFNDKYEFYQAATTKLRGYRSQRFIGKQSVYEYSDFRFDMGKLHNSFAPLQYGLFAGIDCGRVWYPGEDSNKWHSSYGGGLWLTLFNKITTKYSLFGSKDTVRFMFELGLGF